MLKCLCGLVPSWREQGLVVRGQAGGLPLKPAVTAVTGAPHRTWGTTGVRPPGVWRGRGQGEGPATPAVGCGSIPAEQPPFPGAGPGRAGAGREREQQRAMPLQPARGRRGPAMIPGWAPGGRLLLPQRFLGSRGVNRPLDPNMAQCNHLHCA